MDDVGRNHEDIALLGRELILLNQMEAAAGQDDIDFIEFMPVGLDGIICVEESPGQGGFLREVAFQVTVELAFYLLILRILIYAKEL
ncbi:hypothetical protein [uncultured Acetatifactor sp.]|uniref:hypothetical protein n=1 Tax=uncultured Acetatifactor sp. TaxID=1671927 RepID=UPI0026210E21|nr:hypothetical protein [uncultured Acetatifactor sp.]